MKQLYIHKDNLQQGPFTIEEIKEKNISRETLVWHEGAENWLPANQVEELKVLFKSIPPPIGTSNFPPPPLINVENNVSASKPNTTNPTPNKAKKIITYFAIGLIACVFIGGSAYWYEQDKREKLEIKNQLDSQSVKIREQERIETQRIAEENRKSEEEQQKQRNEKKASLQTDYDNAITSLRFANEQLNQIKEFHLGRLNSEKDSQIKHQLEVIRSWENEVDRLKTEISKY